MYYMKNFSEKTSKIITRLVNVFFTIGVFLTCGFFAVIVPATNTSFYKWQFGENDTLVKVQWQAEHLTGEASEYVENMSFSELISLMDHTMKYCLYLEDDLNITVDGTHLEVFRPDEYKHMQDVKKIFGGGYVLLAIGALFFIAGLVYNLKFKSLYYKYARRTAYYTLAVILFILLLIALLAVIDFDTAFAIFHKVLFPGKQWRFADGVMIAMIGQIFTALAPIILGVWLALLAIFCGTIIYCNKRFRRKNSKENAEKNDLQ